MTTTASTTSTGLTGMTLYSVYGVEKTITFQTFTSTEGEGVQYAFVTAPVLGIELTANGIMTIADDLAIPEIGYYALKIKIAGDNNPQVRVTTIDFLVRAIQSNVSITSAGTKTFIDGIGGSVNFTSNVTPAAPESYALNNITL
jgi:hypothetical protein